MSHEGDGCSLRQRLTKGQWFGILTFCVAVTVMYSIFHLLISTYSLELTYCFLFIWMFCHLIYGGMCMNRDHNNTCFSNQNMFCRSRFAFLRLYFVHLMSSAYSCGLQAFLQSGISSMLYFTGPALLAAINLSNAIVWSSFLNTIWTNLLKGPYLVTNAVNKFIMKWTTRTLKASSI